MMRKRTLLAILVTVCLLATAMSAQTNINSAVTIKRGSFAEIAAVA